MVEDHQDRKIGNKIGNDHSNGGTIKVVVEKSFKLTLIEWDILSIGIRKETITSTIKPQKS